MASMPVPPGMLMSRMITSGAGERMANMSACMASNTCRTSWPFFLKRPATRVTTMRSSSATRILIRRE